jgi:hypothetical protein
MSGPAVSHPAGLRLIDVLRVICADTPSLLVSLPTPDLVSQVNRVFPAYYCGWACLAPPGVVKSRDTDPHIPAGEFGGNIRKCRLCRVLIHEQMIPTRQVIRIAKLAGT